MGNYGSLAPEELEMLHARLHERSRKGLSVNASDLDTVHLEMRERELQVPCAEYNENHDSAGRFSSGDGGGGSSGGKDVVYRTAGGVVVTAKDYEVEKPKINVTKDIKEAALSRAKVAERVEPKITKSMSRIAEETGGELRDLDFARKSEESLARKIATEMQEKPGLSMQEATNRVYDTVRYTGVFEPENFVASAKAMDSKIVANGYERVVEPKNYFAKEGTNYKGINANYKEPGAGTVFEVQFHTPDSFAVARGNHKEYEVFRISKSVKQQEKMNAVMIDRWSKIKDPPGIKTAFGGWKSR